MRLFVEVGYRADPGIGSKFVVVEVEFSVLVANGGDAAGAGRPVVAPYRGAVTLVCGVICCDGAEGVGAAVVCPLGADALDDVGERRVDLVGALAFDVVKLLHDCARTRVDGKHWIARIDRRVVVGRRFSHHAGTGARLGDYAVETVVCVLREETRLALLGLYLSLAIS